MKHGGFLAPFSVTWCLKHQIVIVCFKRWGWLIVGWWPGTLWAPDELIAGHHPRTPDYSRTDILMSPRLLTLSSSSPALSPHLLASSSSKQRCLSVLAATFAIAASAINTTFLGSMRPLPFYGLNYLVPGCSFSASGLIGHCCSFCRQDGSDWLFCSVGRSDWIACL